jgi:hypothetical protein
MFKSYTQLNKKKIQRHKTNNTKALFILVACMFLNVNTLHAQNNIFTIKNNTWCSVKSSNNPFLENVRCLLEVKNNKNNISYVAATSSLEVFNQASSTNNSSNSTVRNTNTNSNQGAQNKTPERIVVERVIEQPIYTTIDNTRTIVQYVAGLTANDGITQAGLPQYAVANNNVGYAGINYDVNSNQRFNTITLSSILGNSAVFDELLVNNKLTSPGNNLFGSTTIATATIATSSINSLVWEFATGTNTFLHFATITNATITNATATNLFANNSSTTNSTSTNLFSVNASTTNSTSTNLFAANASTTNSTSTNLFANNSSTTNSTSTNSFVQNLIASNLISTGTVQFLNLSTTSTSTFVLLRDGNNNNLVMRNFSDLLANAPCNVLGGAACVGGNSSTTLGTMFLGRNDSADLAFETNNIERMRISSNGLVSTSNSNGMIVNSTLSISEIGGGAVSSEALYVLTNDTDIARFRTNSLLGILSVETSGGTGQIYYGGSNQRFDFFGNGSLIMFMNAGTSPGMQVEGKIRAQDTLYVANSSEFDGDVVMDGNLFVNGSSLSKSGDFAYYSGRDTGFPLDFEEDFGDCESCSSSDYSIIADGRIAATEFNAYSDARIKNIKSRTTNVDDLEVLKKINITNYTKKDEEAIYGDTAPVYKKVIAQELEAIIPNAVQKVAGSVPVQPPILASFVHDVNNTRTKLFIDNVEYTGDKTYKYVSEDGSSGEWSYNNNKNVTAGATYLTHESVRDFRSVDYDAISMINVSATQELSRMTSAIIELNVSTSTYAQRLKDNIISWLGNADNLIQSIFAKKIYTEELCIKMEYGTYECINKNNIYNINNQSSTTQNPNNQNSTSTYVAPFLGGAVLSPISSEGDGVSTSTSTTTSSSTATTTESLVTHTSSTTTTATSTNP